MRENIYEELKARGLLKQVVYEDELKEKLANEKMKFYCGFDPTADSLTVGHLLAVTLAKRFQMYGHKPYLLMGGGTGMVGDPSHRTDMRKMLTVEQIAHNIECFKNQIKNIIDVESKNGAVIVNNGDWLKSLNYIEFLRDIGAMLSVNKMLSFECFKSRWERGLSFLEFNYMPMQAYDFLYLFEHEGVSLQIGGDDQWANMLVGADLIRRKHQAPAFALTIPLLTKSDGTKMGKTAGGALWLDPNKTKPYELYQYFRNTPDEKVREYMMFLTFLEVEEIEELTKYRDERMNRAKEVFAYEMVKLVHGKEVADAVEKEVKSTFNLDVENMPSIEVKGKQNIVDLLISANFVKSTSEARRMISQGAVKIDEEVVSDIAFIPEKTTFVLSKGKKNKIKVNIE